MKVPLRYNTVRTSTYQYILVHTSMYWYVQPCMSMLPQCATSLNDGCSWRAGMDTEHESGGYTWRHLCCWTSWPQTWCFLYGHAVKANQHQVSVHTSMYLYVLVCTCMYWYLPLWVQILIKRTVDQGWGSRSSSSALSTTGTYLSDGTGSIASSLCEPRKPNSQCH